MILVVSHPADAHARTVVGRLAEAGEPVVVFDTAQVPTALPLSLGYATGAPVTLEGVIEGARHDLAAVRSVWWRRPLPFELDDRMGDPDDRAFAYGECHAAVSGLWSCLDAEWMNDPVRDEVAARKAWQLKVAARLGFRIPRTLITSDPDRAAAFIEAEGDAGVIYKAFSATERAWRETRLLKPEERAQLDAVRHAPVIFQEHIRADIDLRITVVGDQIFPAAIDSGRTDYLVDFRMNMSEADMRPHVLPDAIDKKLRALMAALGLVYGAIDMRLTPDGEYVFLEINPAGQWLFIEERTGQPITTAMVDQLRSMARRRGA